eukprot:3223451-Pyramimonas_sp.AAC.1
MRGRVQLAVGHVARRWPSVSCFSGRPASSAAGPWATAWERPILCSTNAVYQPVVREQARRGSSKVPRQSSRA